MRPIGIIGQLAARNAARADWSGGSGLDGLPSFARVARLQLPRPATKEAWRDEHEHLRRGYQDKAGQARWAIHTASCCLLPSANSLRPRLHRSTVDFTARDPETLRSSTWLEGAACTALPTQCGLAAQPPSLAIAPCLCAAAPGRALILSNAPAMCAAGEDFLAAQVGGVLVAETWAHCTPTAVGAEADEDAGLAAQALNAIRGRPRTPPEGVSAKPGGLMPGGGERRRRRCGRGARHSLSPSSDSSVAASVCIGCVEF